MIAYDINDDDLGIYNENTVICYTSVQRRKCWVTDISNEVLIRCPTEPNRKQKIKRTTIM